jgi:predicted HTH domain antitoxin
MITIKDFMECIDYRVTGGTEYQWQCYGPNVRYLEFQSGEGTVSDTVLILFDTVDQTVYEMQAWDYHNEREYRWIHPDYLDAHKKEAKSRNVKWKKSFDDRKFINLEVEEDILEKATAIARGEEYDTRIMVTLDLGDKERVLLMEMAHEADMSLNQFVEHILREDMKRHGVEV